MSVTRVWSCSTQGGIGCLHLTWKNKLFSFILHFTISPFHIHIHVSYCISPFLRFTCTTFSPLYWSALSYGSITPSSVLKGSGCCRFPSSSIGFSFFHFPSLSTLHSFNPPACQIFPVTPCTMWVKTESLPVYFSYFVAKLSLLKILSPLPLLDHRLIRTYATSEPKRFISGVEILRGVDQMGIASSKVAAQHLICTGWRKQVRWGEWGCRHLVPGNS